MGFRLAYLCPFQGDKAGAETVNAGEILITGGLVDAALGTHGGVQRLNGQAVGLDRAVPAAFTDCVIDKGAQGGVRISPFLAATAFFCSAGLVIDQDGGAGHFAQLALYAVQLIAVIHRRVASQGNALEFLGLVGNHHNLACTLGMHLGNHVRDFQDPVYGLAACHGDGIVVQNLVGDIGVGRDRGSNRQNPRVEIRAIAQVGEDVFFIGKGLLTNPGDAFATHMTEGRGAAIHPDCHIVTANSGHGT